MSTDQFWGLMTAPDAPFPKTAACSPGTFQTAYRKAFDDGADAIVSIHVADTLSGTIKAARWRGRRSRIARSTWSTRWAPRWAKGSSPSSE